MTTVGQLILSVYSLLAITFLIVLSIKRMIKENDEGWELVLLIPVLVLLTNII